MWFVFNELSHYCNSCPQLTKGIRLGNPYFGLQFLTRSLSCFTEIYSSFYDAKGIKRIPEDIYNLLTPVALAHLIMGDGQASVHGLILCTNSYSIKDVVRLMNVLMIRHRLDCTITLKKQNKKVEFLIYIRHGYMPLLRTIVKPYMHTSMLYKIENYKVNCTTGERGSYTTTNKELSLPILHKRLYSTSCFKGSRPEICPY